MASSLFGPRATQPQSSVSNVLPTQLNRIRDMMAIAQSGGRPGKLAQAMLNRNPDYKNVMKLVNDYGGDAKAAFYGEARKRGIDPDSILSMMQ